MSQNWFIRMACPNDADAIARLADALSLHEGDPIGYFGPHAILRDCFGDDAALTIWVAGNAGGLVGFATAQRTYDTASARRGLQLEDLFVEPAFRRQGIARALVAALAQAAKRSGCSYVWWTSKPGNAQAQAFYARIGAAAQPLMAHTLADAALDELAEGADTD